MCLFMFSIAVFVVLGLWLTSLYMQDFQNITTFVVSYVQSWLMYQNKALIQLWVDVSKLETVPKLNFDWLLLQEHAKRGCPTANQSASYENRSHALQFSKHGWKLQQKARCFTADSFYQYLSLLMMGHPRKQTGLKRGDGMEISTQVQSRRRWLKTSRQLTMKHRLKVTKMSTYHQNCHRVFHPIQNLSISTLLRVRNWRTMCREILFLTRKSFSLASGLWISNYWLILCKLYCAPHANDLWVRTVASHTHMWMNTERIRPQNLYLPASAKTNLFCLPQRNVAEFMRREKYRNSLFLTDLFRI